MSLQKDLTRLVEKPPPEKKLGVAATPKTIPPKTGLAPVTLPGGNGNIASPLRETDYLDRTFWDQRFMFSTDGVFSFAWKPIKVVKFLDANDSPVVMEYKEPV